MEDRAFQSVAVEQWKVGLARFSRRMLGFRAWQWFALCILAIAMARNIAPSGGNGALRGGGTTLVYERGPGDYVFVRPNDDSIAALRIYLGEATESGPSLWSVWPVEWRSMWLRIQYIAWLQPESGGLSTNIDQLTTTWISQGKVPVEGFLLSGPEVAALPHHPTAYPSGNSYAVTGATWMTKPIYRWSSLGVLSNVCEVLWILFALLGATALLTPSAEERMERRRRLGLCPHCQYDLTHKFGGRCPECGKETAPAPRLRQ